jgi:FAD:protein FMN transferase
MGADPRVGRSQAAAIWRFEAIGTPWSIETSSILDDRARAAVADAVDRFDREWSRFRPDSLISQLATGGETRAPLDTVEMLDTLAAVADATNGAVNPLVGGSLAARGYDAAYGFLDRGARPAPADWRAQLSWEGGMLRLTAPGTIDVGALGKGRLVDRVLSIVAEHADGDIVVDASGDLAARGATQRVGLEHPYQPARAIGVIEVTDAALCASAVNRRAWGDGLHHVLDARTGVPVRTYAATWAIAPTAMRADAIATALFFDGGPQLAFEWGVEWVRMTTDGRVEWSPGSRAELFTRPATVEA